MPVLATASLVASIQDFATRRGARRLGTGGSPVQRIQQEVCQPGQDLTAGPDEGSAYDGQYPGARERGLLSGRDADHLWL
jgi:hypothetical protein